MDLMNRLTPVAAALRRGFDATTAGLKGQRRMFLTVGVAAIGAWALIKHPPMQTVPRGDIAVRTNNLTGGSDTFREGSVLVLPALHELRTLPLRDQVYRPKSKTAAPFQSVEGLSFDIDLAVRYALDPARVVAASKNLPEDINGQVVEPAVQGVIYQVLTRYTVREIFSSKR